MKSTYEDKRIITASRICENNEINSLATHHPVEGVNDRWEKATEARTDAIIFVRAQGAGNRRVGARRSRELRNLGVARPSPAHPFLPRPGPRALFFVPSKTAGSKKRNNGGSNGGAGLNGAGVSSARGHPRGKRVITNYARPSRRSRLLSL